MGPGCGELAGVDSLRMQRIGQHGFLCVLGHPCPGRLELTFLRRCPAGSADQAPAGGLCPGPICSSHSCVWVQRCDQVPRAGPRPWTFAWAWAWVREVESWGLAVAVGPGESSKSCAARVRGEWPGAGVRGDVDTWIQTLPWGQVGVHAGRGNEASAARGQTPGAGMGLETLLVSPGVALAQAGRLACAPGLRVLVGIWMSYVALLPWCGPP